MNWYYSENNERRGPVSQEELAELARAGTITPDTLVWCEGMANWQAYREMFPAPAPGLPPPIGVPPFPGAGLALAERNGPPWEHRSSLGFWPATVETVKGVLLEPAETFSRMKCEGDLMDPLWFTLLTGGVGAFVAFAYSAIFQGLGMMGRLGGGDLNRSPFGTSHLVGYGIGFFLGMVFVVPVMIVLGAFIWAGILHLLLMLLGGARKPFETTFRVVCYSSGATGLLRIVPICGGVIALVWGIVASIIGLSKAHEISVGKAVAAVLIPFAVCCVITIASFGAIAALIARAANTH